MVSRLTATRVIYLGCHSVPGKRHHRYGASLVLDGTEPHQYGPGSPFFGYGSGSLDPADSGCLDFVKLTRGKCAICGQEMGVPYKWTFYFLITVGVWNFTGAGVFGFLINLPIINYFEVGTLLTPNHGHAALDGRLLACWRWR